MDECGDGGAPTLGTHPAPSIEHRNLDVLSMALASMRAAGDDPLMFYFDAPISGNELNVASDALAVCLAGYGITAGDRIAVQLQNMPQFLIAAVAGWKLGAVIVPINPMYREREMGTVLRDSGARALLTLEELWESMAQSAAVGSDVVVTLTTSGLEYLSRDTPRPVVLAGAVRLPCDGALDLCTVIDECRGQTPPAIISSPDDPAFLVYTSGTTGPAKGAINLHRNVAFAAQIYGRWCSLSHEDVNMCLAPLFHVTGLVAGIGVSFHTGAPLVLGYRFDAFEALRLMERHRASYTVAAITAYAAMLNTNAVANTDLSALRVVLTGGAPVAKSIVDRWSAATGSYIHNSYGLTETTAPAVLVPIGVDAPVDPNSGALSVGAVAYDTTVEICDEFGRCLPDGTAGEIVISGPQVVPGYWGKPELTAVCMPEGRMHSGDIGFRDAEGWIYLIDRKKDMIIASGYKVWPREVEDVLAEHPAVREVAIVGVPDEYRGETVAGFVSIWQGQSVLPSELIDFCRDRLAAYKRPHSITIVDELPKTVTGKILRRTVRQMLDDASAAAE